MRTASSVFGLTTFSTSVYGYIPAHDSIGICEYYPSIALHQHPDIEQQHMPQVPQYRLQSHLRHVQAT